MCLAIASCTPAQPAAAKQTSGDWSTPGLAQPDDMQQRFFKLDNGVKVQQLTSGAGRQAEVGDRVLFDYVLRRSNGYFIYACAPVTTLPVPRSHLQGSACEGLFTGLVQKTSAHNVRVSSSRG